MVETSLAKNPITISTRELMNILGLDPGMMELKGEGEGMNFLGLDPGVSGGIALITDDATVVYKMPETETDILDTLRGCADHRPLFAYLEAVHAMPKQGVSSTFKLGMQYGMLRAFLLALAIPFETVSPGVWQRALGCLSKGDKNVTKRKAQELHPQIKVTHATADALLITDYGRRKYDRPT